MEPHLKIQSPQRKQFPALTVIADLKRHQCQFVRHVLGSQFKFKTTTRPDDNKNTRGLSISRQYITYSNYSGHPIPPDSQHTIFRKLPLQERCGSQSKVCLITMWLQELSRDERSFPPLTLDEIRHFFYLFNVVLSACMTYLVFNGKEEVRGLFLLKNKHLSNARRRKIFRMSRGFCCFDCSIVASLFL